MLRSFNRNDIAPKFKIMVSEQFSVISAEIGTGVVRKSEELPKEHLLFDMTTSYILI